MTRIKCSHHWVIEPPEAEFSKGICKKCDRKKKFKNIFTRNTWEESVVPDRSWSIKKPRSKELSND